MSDLQTYAEAVRVIKEAILRSQYRAAFEANKEQLSLYYGIGCYVSKNSREGFWGKGAIETISQQLQKELPGLRGFSATNIKNMRSFYEEWSPVINSQPMADENKTLTEVSDSELDERVLEKSIVDNIKRFILTFGQDFIFVGNQYRVGVSGECTRRKKTT